MRTYKWGNAFEKLKNDPQATVAVKILEYDDSDTAGIQETVEKLLTEPCRNAEYQIGLSSLLVNIQEKSEKGGDGLTVTLTDGKDVFHQIDLSEEDACRNPLFCAVESMVVLALSDHYIAEIRHEASCFAISLYKSDIRWQKGTLIASTREIKSANSEGMFKRRIECSINKILYNLAITRCVLTRIR